ncbi:hypothetical protein ZIOFF_002786 [Zingiber officinale]|uniref:Uncharacterized protein n=1 Tax=Zingiber officinale TaxID=94328 RepID=A0A8J5LZD1_ZINOF|nr:hypothetical protein ZIOFF_002786 [Zingiber officinale]
MKAKWISLASHFTYNSLVNVHKRFTQLNAIAIMYLISSFMTVGLIGLNSLDSNSKLNTSLLSVEGLTAWTNGRVRAAPHRITVGDQNLIRYAAILFSVPQDDYVIQAPAELVDNAHPSLFNPYKYGDFLGFLLTEEGVKAEDKLTPYRRVVRVVRFFFPSSLGHARHTLTPSPCSLARENTADSLFSDVGCPSHCQLRAALVDPGHLSPSLLSSRPPPPSTHAAASGVPSSSNRLSPSPRRCHRPASPSPRRGHVVEFLPLMPHRPMPPLRMLPPLTSAASSPQATAAANADHTFVAGHEQQRWTRAAALLYFPLHTCHLLRLQQ